MSSYCLNQLEHRLLHLNGRLMIDERGLRERVVIRLRLAKSGPDPLMRTGAARQEILKRSRRYC